MYDVRVGYGVFDGSAVPGRRGEAAASTPRLVSATVGALTMQIAPGVRSDTWTSLQLDHPNSPDWKDAIEIFKTRISARYIDPADLLIAVETQKPPTERRFGFTILGIDCLLVETLSAFIEGIVDTTGKSKATFRKFLRSRAEFATVFTSDNLADDFYKQIRCGILHQAETGEDALVWSIGPMLRVENGSIKVVNRTAFHDALKREFQRYVDELSDAANVQLRKHFREKMNFIAR